MRTPARQVACRPSLAVEGLVAVGAVLTIVASYLPAFHPAGHSFVSCRRFEVEDLIAVVPLGIGALAALVRFALPGSAVLAASVLPLGAAGVWFGLPSGIETALVTRGFSSHVGLGSGTCLIVAAGVILATGLGLAARQEPRRGTLAGRPPLAARVGLALGVPAGFAVPGVLLLRPGGPHGPSVWESATVSDITFTAAGVALAAIAVSGLFAPPRPAELGLAAALAAYLGWYFTYFGLVLVVGGASLASFGWVALFVEGPALLLAAGLLTAARTAQARSL